MSKASAIKVALPLLLALFVAGCHEDGAVLSEPLRTPSAQQASDVFSRVCLAGLPSFVDFPTRAEKAGLAPAKLKAPATVSYQLPGTALFVAVATARTGLICTMAVDSPEQPALFGKAILAAARTVGGAAKERAYKSSFFKYAYQLRNGSVLTQQVIELSGPNSRSVFFVTGPVRADQVDYLIYD